MDWFRALIATWLLAAAGLARAAEPQTLSFDDALRLVTAQNIAARQADEAVGSTAARETQTQYLYFPTLAATGSAARAKAPPELTPATSRAVGLTANLNVFRFGGDEAKQAVAKAAAASAAFSRTAAGLDAELQGAEALFAVISAERELLVAQGFVAVRRDSAKMARRLYEQGVRPVQEAEKVEIDAANEEARLADTQVKLAQSHAALARLAGVRLALNPAWPWASRLMAGPEPSVLKAVPDLTVRPERRALAATARALELGLRDLRARWLPSLDLNANYQYIQQTDPDALGKSLSGTLTLTVPLFDQLSARTDYQEQAHRKVSADLDVEAKDRELQAAWEEARTSFASSLASAKTRDKTLGEARQLYESSLKSFRSGMLSANELSLDQSRLYDTELNAVHGWADAHLYYARLCHSLGMPLGECVKL